MPPHTASKGAEAKVTAVLANDAKKRAKSDVADAEKAPGFSDLLFLEKASFLGGLVMLLVLVPLVGSVVATAVLWDAVDRCFMGRPLDGVLMSLASKINKVTHGWNQHFVRRAEDSYMVNAIILLGGVVPAMWGYCLYQTMTHGFDARLCFVYHVLRIGPYFMNFAYVYTLCHKEGHSRMGLWKPRYGVLNNIFNWWIGLFYGVLPSSFAYGHSINHHKYNNGPHDVISTADKARDSWVNLVAYLPRWTCYAINLSTTWQFYKEGNKPIAIKMVTGSLWWFGFYFLVHSYNAQFALWYTLFPLGENILLLACVNWCWHAFLNPDDPTDDFVGSITIFDGPINVLNEDFHVVHHQYPGAHWTEHPKLYQKHKDSGEYSEHVASAFRNTHAFELFFLIILREYDVMADKFVNMSQKQLTRDQIKDLIKTRLRTCWWGHRANLKSHLVGKEIGNLMDGKPFLAKTGAEAKKDQ